ncbi:MAG TPA: hypothetical protein VFB79_23515 [Candidatus Angelobacter sp.]|nr:hypothetical protein [Candidatus Angelobacter sp.]
MSGDLTGGAKKRLQSAYYNKISLVLACAIAFMICASAQGQAGKVVSAPAQSVDAKLDQSFRYMYDLQFDQALREVEAAKALDKADPVPWMSQGCAVLFREFDRMHILRSELFGNDNSFSDGPPLVWNAAARTEFENALGQSEKLAQDRLKQDKNDPRALFALTMVNGLRADDAALIAKKKFSAISYTKTATGYAEKLLARSPEYYDAYIATGMGKYIIGGKAAPVRWLLRLDGLKGDQEQGIKELTLVEEHGRYLSPFARILLAFDDLRHKNNAQARKELEWLHEHFPDNPLFLREIAKLDHPAMGMGQH